MALQLLCEGFDPSLVLDLAYVRNKDKVCMLSGEKSRLEESAKSQNCSVVESLEEVGVYKPVNEDSDDDWKVDGEAKFVVEGPYQRWGVRNANKRMYPKEFFAWAVGDPKSPVMESVRSRQMAGHLEHPADGRTSLKEIGLLTTHLSLHPTKTDEGKTGIVRGRSELTETPNGSILKGLSKSGYRWGVSSRGRGSVDNDGNVKWSGKNESDDFQLQTFDAVADPSTPGARPEPVKESVEAKTLAEGKALLKECSGRVETKSGKTLYESAMAIPGRFLLVLVPDSVEGGLPVNKDKEKAEGVLSDAVNPIAEALKEGAKLSYKEGTAGRQSVEVSGEKRPEPFISESPEAVLASMTKGDNWRKDEKSGMYVNPNYPGTVASVNDNQIIFTKISANESTDANDKLSLTFSRMPYTIAESLDEAAFRVDVKKQATADIEGVEPLVKNFEQYIKRGNTFEPVGKVELKENLGRHAYRIGMSFTGPQFTKVKLKTDELYHLKDAVTESVLKEIDKFWGLKEGYEKLGLRHVRGLLLHGVPGTGKSSTINQVVEMIVERGDVVFYTNSVGVIAPCMKAFREIEPDRKVVIVLEDADGYINYEERTLLNLMDGEEMFEGVLWLATTNYINRFPPRLLRPGRFDKKIMVPPPTLEARSTYLQRKLKQFNVSEKDCMRVAKELQGLSFGHLKEYIASVYAMGEPEAEVIERLKSEKHLVESSLTMNENFADPAWCEETRRLSLAAAKQEPDFDFDFDPLATSESGDEIHAPGTVVTIKNGYTGKSGTRRYVVVTHSPLSGHDLVALSGGTVGSAPSGVPGKLMTPHPDQTKAFSGKEKSKLRDNYAKAQDRGQHFGHAYTKDKIPLGESFDLNESNDDLSLEEMERKASTKYPGNSGHCYFTNGQQASHFNPGQSTEGNGQDVTPMVESTDEKLGDGSRFKSLTAKLKAKGSTNPAALAAWIGRKKYGAKKFDRIAHESIDFKDRETKHMGIDRGDYVEYKGKGDSVYSAAVLHASNPSKLLIRNEKGIQRHIPRESIITHTIGQAFAAGPKAHQDDKGLLAAGNKRTEKLRQHFGTHEGAEMFGSNHTTKDWAKSHLLSPEQTHTGESLHTLGFQDTNMRTAGEKRWVHPNGHRLLTRKNEQGLHEITASIAPPKSFVKKKPTTESKVDERNMSGMHNWEKKGSDLHYSAPHGTFRISPKSNGKVNLEYASYSAPVKHTEHASTSDAVKSAQSTHARMMRYYESADPGAWKEVGPKRFKRLAENIGFTLSANLHRKSGLVEFKGQGDSVDNLVAFELITPQGSSYFVAENDNDYTLESLEILEGTEWVPAIDAVVEGKVNEKGIARIFRHMDSSGEKGYAILSADRHERSEPENKVHRKALENHLRKIGKGFTHVIGGYVEHAPTGETKVVCEHSYFVPGISRKDARALAKHAYKAHGQEAILHGHSEHGAHLIYHTGKREKVGDQASLQHASTYFTAYKNRKFGMGDKVRRPIAASIGNESVNKGNTNVLTAIHNHAVHAAYHRLSGNISKAMRHETVIDRMHRTAELGGYGDDAVEAEESGRGKGRDLQRSGKKPEPFAHKTDADESVVTERGLISPPDPREHRDYSKFMRAAKPYIQQHIAQIKKRNFPAGFRHTYQNRLINDLKSNLADRHREEWKYPHMESTDDPIQKSINVLFNSIDSDAALAAVTGLQEKMKELGTKPENSEDRKKISEALVQYARESFARTQGVDELDMGRLGNNPLKTRKLVGGHAPKPNTFGGKVKKFFKIRNPGESNDSPSLQTVIRERDDAVAKAEKLTNRVKVLRSELDTAESALVQLTAVRDDEEEISESADRANAGVSNGDGRQTEASQKNTGRMLPVSISESQPLPTDREPPKIITEEKKELPSTLGVYHRWMAAKKN